MKGRDGYDLVWYVGQNQPVRIKHLENRMKQTGDLAESESLTEEALKKRLREKIESMDFKSAAKDAENLLKDPSSLKLWSKEFFRVVCEGIKAV